MEAPDPRAGTAGPPRRLNVPAAGPADGAPGGGGVHMVVVHHDRPDTCAHTVAAFEALAEVTSVCVVDSSSHPAASGRLRELLPGAEIIDAGGNVGFGPGANLGLRRWLRHGSGPWVGVAPHDAVPAPDAIARILHETEARPDAGLVSAEFGPEFALVPVFDKVMGGFYRAAPRGSGWQDVDYPHGTLLLARRELLEDIGLFRLLRGGRSRFAGPGRGVGRRARLGRGRRERPAAVAPARRLSPAPQHVAPRP
jgi:hypothetical protein